MRLMYGLVTVGLILVVLGVTLGIGAKVTDDIQHTMCAGSALDLTAECSNSTAGGVAANSTIAIGSLADWESMISTVVAAVVIIGLLIAGFGGFMAFGKGRV